MDDGVRQYRTWWFARRFEYECPRCGGLVETNVRSRHALDALVVLHERIAHGARG